MELADKEQVLRLRFLFLSMGASLSATRPAAYQHNAKNNSLVL